MPSNTDVINGAYEAFGRGDVAAVFAAFAPDLEWTTPESMKAHGIGGTRKGHAEIGAFFGQLQAVFAELRLEPQEFVESGDRLVVLGTHHMRAPGGTTGTIRFVHSWTVVDGKAIRFEEFYDTAEVNRLLAS